MEEENEKQIEMDDRTYKVNAINYNRFELR